MIARVSARLLIACPWSVMVHLVGPILQWVTCESAESLPFLWSPESPSDCDLFFRKSYSSFCSSAYLNQYLGLANFYLSTWEEYHTGTLYLSYFSGPVEGILIIIVVHIISGIYGAEFWLQSIGDVAILPAVVANALPPFMAEIQLNKVSLAFGALGLTANIIAAWVIYC